MTDTANRPMTINLIILFSLEISFSLRFYTFYSNYMCTLPQCYPRSDKIFTFSFIYQSTHNNNLMRLSVSGRGTEQRHSMHINVARIKITIFIAVACWPLTDIALSYYFMVFSFYYCGYL